MIMANGLMLIVKMEKSVLFGMVLLQLYFVKIVMSEVVFIENLNISAYDSYSKFDKQDVSEYFNSFVLQRLPPLDLTVSNNISATCQLHSAEFQKQLKNLTFWAIKMYDASAKIPSGILNGNINQFGDFDECINSEADNGEISGQYCLASFQTIQPNPNSPYLFHLHNLINSHYPVHSDLKDPGHVVPRFASINWALCVPASCSHTDVEIGLKTGLQTFLVKSGLSLNIKVHEESCQTVKNSISWSTIIVGLIFAAYICFVLMVTIIDYYFQYPINESNEILFAFSLHRNLKSAFSLERSTNDLQSVHGIRFLNMTLIFLVHKSLFTLYSGFVNKTVINEYIISFWSVAGQALSLYTDTFLMLSGMLLAYSYFGRINRGKQIYIIEEYTSRIIRILPPFIVTILFVGFIHPVLGSGPQWNSIVVHNSKLCQSYWWRNLLFIHNYFGLENMCLPHSHQIGTDTVLFFISPLFLWILWKCKKYGVFLLLVVATWSTVLRYHVMYTNNLSFFFHYGASLKQIYDASNFMYILPTHRATSYIIGILFGYYLRNLKNVILKPIVLNIGHATAIALFCIAFFGPRFMSEASYEYDPKHAASYTAFSPIPWCLFWMWIIFTDSVGYRNAFTKFLSWPGFLITTRFSYAIYLTQLPIFFHNAATNRTTEYFQPIKILLNLHEFSVIVLCSIILTLIFDSPFEKIKKIYLKKYERKFVKNDISKTE